MKRASYHKKPMVILPGLFCLFLMIQNAHAYQFKVGGSGDWSLTSSSSFDQWAQKSRFQTGDTILFNYEANEDSLLQVTEAGYKNCNSASPIAKYSDGHTLIILNQSGPHYFISGLVDHCKHNEKIVIVVLASRSNHTSNPPSSSPPALPPALPPAPTSEQFASPPPAPVAPEPDLNPAPSPAHSDENPPPSLTPNGASSMVVNLFCFFGTFVGFVFLS